MTYIINACETPEQGGGLYACRLSSAGTLSLAQYLPADRPMYTVTEGNTLYASLRQAVGEESGIVQIPLQHGTMGTPSAPRRTHGRVAAHLCVKDGEIYAANYLSGNVVKLPDTVVAYRGHGPHPTRQEASHPHCVIPSPCGRYMLVTDLGRDRIQVLTRALAPVCEAAVPAGHGARHILFSHNGRYLYCVNELAATVSVFAWEADTGRLTLLHTADSGVPADLLPKNTAGAIRLSGDGKRLYISNRGEETIVVFATQDGVHFDLVQKVPCGGKHPRDFILTPDEGFLLSANMLSGTVDVFALHGGLVAEQRDSFAVPQPLCITPVAL